MKKIILLLALSIGFVVTAQEKSVKEKDAYKLVELISKPLFDPLVTNMSKMVKQDQVESFIKEVEGTYPELFNSLSKIYAEELSHTDIKEILNFYNSPVGKKLLSKQGVLQQKGMLAGQSWGMKLQGIMSKYQ